MQYNTIVNYMKSRKYGAKGVFLTDYTDAIQTFTDYIVGNWSKLLETS